MYLIIKVIKAIFICFFVVEQLYVLAASPEANPVATYTYNTQTKYISIQANLSYTTSSSVLYTYVLDFKPWNYQTSSIYNPGLCSNRRSTQFNTTNPLPWSKIWDHSIVFNAQALNGSWSAWPKPSNYWGNMTVANLAQRKMSYNGLFTIDQIVTCAGQGNINIVTTSTSIIYSGNFYVVWVQPISPLGAASNIYSTQSYPFPFVVTVPRDVQSITTDPTAITAVYSYMLQANPVITQIPSSAGPSGGSTIPAWKVSIVLQTTTPASFNALGALVNYNSLKILQIVQNDTSLGGPTLSLNISTSTMNCTIDTQLNCIQFWVLETNPIYNQTSFNNSYLMIAAIQSCPILYINNGTGQGCVATNLLVSIPVAASSMVGSISSINLVSSIISSISYFTNSSLNVQRTSASYLPGEIVYFRMTTSLGPVDRDFYDLDIENIWLCYPVVGGFPPYIGYDSTLGQQRYGCQYPEQLTNNNNAINIPSSQIFAIVNASSTSSTSTSNGGTLGYDYQSIVTGDMFSSEVGGSFNLRGLFSSSSGSSSISSIYNIFLHIDAILSPNSGFLLTTATTPSAQNKVNLKSDKIKIKMKIFARFIPSAEQEETQKSTDGNYLLGTLTTLNVSAYTMHNSNGGSSTSTKIIIASVSTSIVAVFIIALFIVYCCLKKKLDTTKEDKREREMKQMQDTIYTLNERIHRPKIPSTNNSSNISDVTDVTKHVKNSSSRSRSPASSR